MKILMVNYRVGTTFSGGVAAIAALMRHLGHDVRLTMPEADTTQEAFQAEVREFDPAVVACSTYSFQWKKHEKFLGWAKEVKPDTLTVVGGYHPTFMPEDVIGSDAVDVMCKGEGEGPLMELLEAIEKGTDHTQIANLYVKERHPDGTTTIHRNPYRNLIQDLDSLPPWDYDVYDINSLLEIPGCMTFVQVPHILPTWSGRGCPYLCSFCCNTGLREMYRGKDRFVRERSVDDLITDLKRVKEKYPKVRALEFQDETFEHSTPWIDELVERFPREIGLPFSICITGKRLDRKYADKLKRAGCLMVYIGVEHGNEKFRFEKLNKPTSNAEIENAFQVCKDANIVTCSLNMIGLPHETPELARETIAFNRKLMPSAVWYGIFQPFPGTPLFDECKEHEFTPGSDEYLYEGVENGLNQPTMPPGVLRQIDREMKDLQKEVEEFHRGQDPIGAALADFQAMQERFRREAAMQGSWDDRHAS